MGGGGNACKTISADISIEFIVFRDVEMNGDISYAAKCTLSNDIGVG